MQLHTFLLKFLLLLLLYYFVKDILLAKNKVIEGLDTSAGDSSEDPTILFEDDSSESANTDTRVEESVGNQTENINALNDGLTISS